VCVSGDGAAEGRGFVNTTASARPEQQLYQSQQNRKSNRLLRVGKMRIIVGKGPVLHPMRMIPAYKPDMPCHYQE
jgi:hypothetical protein